MRSRSSDLDGAPASDPLSEVLQDIRLSSVSYGRCELTHPWGIDFQPQSPARFHFVAEGDCWLHTSSIGWTPLHEGDVVLLPHGTGHELADTVGGHTKPLDQIPMQEVGEQIYKLREGGGGVRTLLACCSVRFGESELDSLLELMPPVLLVRGAASNDPTLTTLLDAMAKEVVSERIGAATIMTRLADVIITRVIRAWVEGRNVDTAGWLGAVRDPNIGRALAAIHRRPGDPWSVESLAHVAHTSRSIFSERFTSVVGMPPARYLARWRMHLASLWLRSDHLTVAQTAARLGYGSEASFSRAFKRFQGMSPSSLRPARPTGQPRPVSLLTAPSWLHREHPRRCR